MGNETIYWDGRSGGNENCRLDLTEITKVTDIAIFRNAFAEVTEIMQIKSQELLAVVTKIGDLTEITRITDYQARQFNLTILKTFSQNECVVATCVMFLTRKNKFSQYEFYTKRDS